MPRDCFVVLTTSKGNRGNRLRMWERSAKFFNLNVRPMHPDVPLLIFSEGCNDLGPEDRSILQALVTGPLEFRDVSLQPPPHLQLGDPHGWIMCPQWDVGYRGMCYFYAWGIGQVLRDEFDYICRFDDDSYFLSKFEYNMFDRLREEDAWYAFRGTYPEDHRKVKDLKAYFNYDNNRDRGVPGLGIQKEMSHTIFTNFSIFRRDLFDQPIWADYMRNPEIQKRIFTHLWGDAPIHTALLSRAPAGKCKLWTDFKYGHGPIGPRYTMALGPNNSFLPPSRWPADVDGNLAESSRPDVANRLRRVAAPTDRLIPAEHRKKALVVIGDGLGNVVAQTPLVRAVTSLFADVHVWMPRSRPDLPDLLRDMPRVASVNTQWIDAFEDPDAIFQTWLVAPQANGKKFNSVQGRYESKQPRDRSEVDVCLDAARKAGWDAPNLPAPFVGWDPWVSPEETDDLAGPLIGFTTGRLHRAMWELKEYPPTKYAEVVDLIRRRLPRARFVQVGWKHDKRIEHEAVLDCRLRGTLRQSMGLIRCCAVFCGNDTGLSWAASALGVPAVVVFGPTDPRKSLPPWGAVQVSQGLGCQPCQWTGIGKYPHNHQQCQHECMQQLPAERIANAVLELLDAGMAARELRRGLLT